jgi:UPF0755 protein
MRRILLIVFLAVFLGIIAIVWIFLGPGTGFSTSKQTLYISSKAPTKEAVLDSLKKHDIIKNETAFNFLASRLGYWKTIRPGKYEFTKGTSLLSIVRRLRNHRQTPVPFVIIKFRTKEDFARITGNKFEFDSTDMINFLNSNDSLAAFNADSETAMWNILPDNYTFFWNTTPGAVYRKMYQTSKKFWTEERKSKAADHGLTPVQAYILASIVEEETNNNKEKDTIASVYLNRMNKGVPLAADPTIKFALKDFGIRWIHGGMLDVQSPYNTYKRKGLPPGPICTPSKKTIDAVLNAPSTTYLFFVANSNFKGTHLFSTTFKEHELKAKAYQEEDKRRREEKEAR